MSAKESLYAAGLEQARRFCLHHKIAAPDFVRLARTDRLYHLATCAYYRPTTISMMVEKCASPGLGGRAWSWPGYVIDRTPFGVLQHELGHHVDHLRSDPAKSRDDVESLFSWKIYQQSLEEPLTGYLGTDGLKPTFYMEWFAENFRLFVTNADLSRIIRPRFYAAMTKAGFKDINTFSWEQILRYHEATDRIIEQARKKIAARPQAAELSLT